MSRTTYGTQTTKSALGLARGALAAGRKALPHYSHVNSPKFFTQHQLFALLVLKQFFKTDYRGLMVRVRGQTLTYARMALEACAIAIHAGGYLMGISPFRGRSNIIIGAMHGVTRHAGETMLIVPRLCEAWRVDEAVVLAT